jgi:transcriptional regulator with XRE-family HTH domain
MLHSAQIRAARALLDWRQEDLSRAAKVALATVQRIEAGKGMAGGNVATIFRIQQALEKAGVQFQASGPDGGPGVRLVK